MSDKQATCRTCMGAGKIRCLCEDVSSSGGLVATRGKNHSYVCPNCGRRYGESPRRRKCPECGGKGKVESY